jgi:phage-related protein
VATLSAILQGLVDLIPQVVEVVITLFSEIIRAASELIPQIVQLGVDIIMAFLDGIKQLIPKVVETGTAIIVAIINGIADMLVAIVEAAFELIVTFLNGIADAIRGNYQALLDAGANILSAIWEGIVATLGGLWEDIKAKGGEIISGIKAGLDEKIQTVKDWFIALPGKIKDWFVELWEDLKEAGSNLIQGIIDGILNREEDVHATVSNVATNAVKTIKKNWKEKSPSKVSTELGKYFGEGLANGIRDSSAGVYSATEKLGNTTLDLLNEAANETDGLGFNELNDPVIRPVLDLSEIQNGEGRIQDLLNGDYGVGFLGTIRPNGAAAQAANSGDTTINMTINGAEGQDVETLADIVTRRINQSLKSKERVWA